MANNNQNKFFSAKNILILAVVFISALFASAKWPVALFAWIGFTFSLRYYRDNNWKGYLISIPILTIAATIANTEIIPLDFKSVMVFMLIINTIGLLPYLLDRLLLKKVPRWAKTLVFPTVFTIFNIILDQGPQGSWGSVAYTQFEFPALMQLASITGIYGINFIIYWFASYSNSLYENWNNHPFEKAQFWSFPLACLFILAFGYYHLNKKSDIAAKVKTSAITMSNLMVMSSMYETSFDKEIIIPESISQSDPILQELQKGMTQFMANPNDQKYAEVYEAMDEILEKYIEATKKVAMDGSRVVTWSEAAITNIKSREGKYEQIVAQIADSLDIYLFFPTAVFHPDKVGKEDVFIENKVLCFGPEGKLLNTYFKNIPIFGVEPSFPGDGTIPVINTPYGNLSPIICYDADHAQLISQISDLETDLLVVPTGDWEAISPYHTYMAAVRCIENGVSMIKSTSNGLSAFIDDKGRIMHEYDFFDNEPIKILSAEISVSSNDTFYKNTYPIFVFALLFFMICMVLFIVIQFFRKR